MSKQRASGPAHEMQSDEEIRRLVLERLHVLSADEAISIGALGSFVRDEMIDHVKCGDEIGKTLEAIEINWIRSLKERHRGYADHRDET